MEFQENNFFFKISTFFCFVNDLSVIFGFLTQKLKTKMHYCKFPRWPLTGQKRRTVVQTFNCNISETIWDRTLKFGTFTYLKSMYIGSKFYWNLKKWVSSMSHFDVEFPNCTRFHLFLNHHCYLQNIFLHKNFSHSKTREECIMSYIYFNFWKCSWIAFTCSKQWKH